ncbi:MAG: hypothetical protein H7145_08215 [Akkermansiaceae bacterium]|nr:hypothetical protein [Armatimonadota bacterium]
MSVVKLGGSLITNKERVASFCRLRTQRLAWEIASANRPVIVVHGTGSFGKPPAVQHGYDQSGALSESRGEVVAEVAASLHILRGHVLNCLVRAGMRPVGLGAVGLYRTGDGRIRHYAPEPVNALLERGMTPVISGDLVPEEGGGFAVCSSDLIAAHQAVYLSAQCLIFATDSPVLLPSQGGKRRTMVGELHPEHAAVGEIRPTVRDVSGGMFGKLNAGFDAARAGVETMIVDGRVPSRLRDAILGIPVRATRLRAEVENGGGSRVPKR